MSRHMVGLRPTLRDSGQEEKGKETEDKVFYMRRLHQIKAAIAPLRTNVMLPGSGALATRPSVPITAGYNYPASV